MQHQRNFILCLRSKTVVRVAVASAGHALRWASPELRGNRALVLLAVATAGQSLQEAAPALRGDRGVVRAALAADGLALAHASPGLRRDRGLVALALAKSGDALALAAPGLRADPTLVAVAVSSAGRRALRWAAPELRRRGTGGFEEILAAGLAAAFAFRTAFLAGTICCLSSHYYSYDAIWKSYSIKNDDENKMGRVNVFRASKRSEVANKMPPRSALKCLGLLDEETGTALRRLVAEFAGVPYGQTLRDFQAADRKLREEGQGPISLSEAEDFIVELT